MTHGATSGDTNGTVDEKNKSFRLNKKCYGKYSSRMVMDETPKQFRTNKRNEMKLETIVKIIR